MYIIKLLLFTDKYIFLLTKTTFIYRGTPGGPSGRGEGLPRAALRGGDHRERLRARGHVRE